MKASFVLPSFRLPLGGDSNDGDDEDNDSDEQEWTVEGSKLWENSMDTVPVTVIVNVQAGFGQLQRCRRQVAQAIKASSPQKQQQDGNKPTNNSSRNLDAISNALLQYVALLRQAKQELQQVLRKSSSKSSSASTSAASNNHKSASDGGRGGQQPNEDSKSFCFSSVEEDTAANSGDSNHSEPKNTSSLSSSQLLLLKWKDDMEIMVRPATDTTNSNSSSSSSPLASVIDFWESIWDWELNHAYYNLSLVEWNKARNCDDSRPGWKQAGTHWQTAASWMQYLRTKQQEQQQRGEDLPLKGTQILRVWESYMIAEAQQAAYQYVATAPRPSPLMLAKIAAGAVPLYQKAAQQTNSEGQGIFSVNSEVWTLWHMLWSALAEYHQAAVHAYKKQHIQAIGRLDRALPLARLAHEYYESLSAEHTTDAQFLQPIQKLLQQHLIRGLQQELQPQIQALENELGATAAIPTAVDFPEIPPQMLVKLQPLQVVQQATITTSQQQLSLLPPPATSPMFPILSKTCMEYRRAFYNDLAVILQQTAQTAETRTEQARQALAKVDLPHALVQYQRRQEKQQKALDESSSATASQQESTAEGRAAALWRRVERIQRGNSSNNNNILEAAGASNNNNVGLSELQQGLWELRDHAEEAHALLNEVEEQLQENVTLDQEFSEQFNDYNSKFSVKEIQTSFWNSLQKYQQLLQSASTGDQVLFGRLESLPTDPKFQLLSKLTSNQIERLVQASPMARHLQPLRRHPPSRALTECVQRLNQHLLDLSGVFQIRDELVHNKLPAEMQAAVQQATQNFLNLPPLSATEQDEAVLQDIVQQAQPAVQACLDEIRSNLSQQPALLRSILQENESFTQLLATESSESSPPVARAATSNSDTATPSSSMAAAERTLNMLEEALEEMEQFQSHWQQGRVFYQGVIPKLQKLQQQVSELSTRLAIDRCEYLDEITRSQQEAKDAEMAAAMASEDGRANNDNRRIGHDNAESEMDVTQLAAASAQNAHPPLPTRPLYPQQSTVQRAEALPDSNNNKSSNTNNVEGIINNSIHAEQSQGDQASNVGYINGNNQEEVPTTTHHSRLWQPGQQGSNRTVRRDSSLDSMTSDTLGSSLVQHLRNSEVQVDDEKVASLVAMEFDFERVVASLRKYNNNMERALNDLLSA